MKLALVHDWLTGMRGGEKCLEIFCRRFPEANLFTLLHVRGSTSSAIERMNITTSRLGRLPGVGNYYRYLLPLMPGAVDDLRLPEDTDLVLSFSHAVAKGIRPPVGVPHVCYCFTPMRYAWQRRDDYLPQAGPDENGVFFARVPRAATNTIKHRLLDHLRDWDRDTSDRVTHFIAASRTIAERIQNCYGRPSRIIYPPVDTDFYTPDPQLQRGDEYLCVSALVPYKRIDLAVAACNRLRKKLVIIGRGPEMKRLDELAGPTVRLIGWQSDEEIRAHFRRCRALLFPGNEDFGIVPLEAQACGAPVLAYAAGGATETVIPPTSLSRGTGVFFHEQAVDAVCETLLKFEADRTCTDPELGRRQSLRFNKQRFEREMVNYLRDVYERKATRSLSIGA